MIIIQNLNHHVFLLKNGGGLPSITLLVLVIQHKKKGLGVGSPKIPAVAYSAEIFFAYFSVGKKREPKRWSKTTTS